MKDYYKTLGLQKSASAAEIKKAFRTLAKKYHPDVNSGDAGAEERFKEVNEAYAVLSDPEKRQQYDQFGAEGFRQRFSQEDIFKGSDIFSVLNDLFGGGGRGGGAPGGGGFESMFGNIFGGGPRRGSRAGAGGPPPAGQNYETELVLALDEAFHGGRRRLSLQSQDGQTINVEVTIPAGVKEGQRMRLAGKGGASPMGGPAGDLLLVLRIAPHPQFKLDGNDLLTEVPVPVSTFALGGEVEVPTLEGPLRKIKVKAGSPLGARMRIRGAGMGKKGGPRGNLYVTLQGQLPEQLDDAQRALFEQLRATGV
jgi:curved DNA-binding protein